MMLIVKLRHWLARRICRRYAGSTCAASTGAAWPGPSPSSTRTWNCTAIPTATPWHGLASSTTRGVGPIRRDQHTNLSAANLLLCGNIA